MTDQEYQDNLEEMASHLSEAARKVLLDPTAPLTADCTAEVMAYINSLADKDSESDTQ